MIALLVCGVIGIATYVSAANGEWGSAAIGAVIIVFLLVLKSAARDESEAYYNAVQYWKNGGPNGGGR